MRIVICLALASALRAAPPTADTCHDAGPEDAARLAGYLVTKYNIPAQNNFRLEHDERVNGCYHKLQFRGS